MQKAIESPPVASRQRGRLLKILGVGFGLAVIIGNTIGGGIVSAPGMVAAYLPHVWMFVAVWIAGGMYALLGAVSVAELGAMLPRSGGQYIFARHAFGDYTGFIVGWSDWVSTCGATAFIALLAAQYTAVLFPSLANQTVSVALAIVILFALLQWRGLRWGSAAQNISSIVKALAFMTLVVACFALGGKGAAEESAAAAVQPSSLPLLASIILSLQAVIYTYDGWTGVTYFSEEVRDPARDIPRSMLGGVLAVIAIYLLVNLAVLYVLPISKVAGADLALGAAAQVVFGANGDTIFRSLMIVSLLSAINACHLIASRILFAMSRDGLMSASVARVNEGGTPSLALLLSVAVAAFFILTGTIDQVLAVAAFFYVFDYAISFAAVFALRRREPERQRPYRAWGYPWTTALSFIGSIAFLVGVFTGDTRNSLYALALLALSYPVFRLLKRLSNPQ